MSRHIYKLLPHAADWDPNWDLASNQGEVIVRADTPADARIVASEAEPDFLEQGGKPAQGGSSREASAFRNEKLYLVQEILDGPYDSTGPREVLAGQILNPLKTAPAASST